MPAPSLKTPERMECMERMAHEGYTQQDVADALGVNATTISKWWKDEKAEPWPQSRTGRKPGERVQWVCEQCGKTEEMVPSKARRRRFCSRDCTNQWQREQVEMEEVECPCGTIFERYPSSEQQFCSRACSNRLQTKRQPDPENYVTFVCETCGDEVTRYRNYGNGANRFCSNACAHRAKPQRIAVPDGDEYAILDSAWEALVWGALRFAKEVVERVDRTTAIEWREGQVYAPDLYLPHRGLWLEVKGWENDEDHEERWNAWRDQRGSLLVLRRSDLEAATQALMDVTGITTITKEMGERLA